MKIEKIIFLYKSNKASKIHTHIILDVIIEIYQCLWDKIYDDNIMQNIFLCIYLKT